MTGLLLWISTSFGGVAFAGDVPAEIVEGVGVEPFGELVTDEGEVLVRVDALAHRLRCPVCQGLSVGDSTSDAAVGMKSRIIELVRYGYTDDQITDYFVDRYGTWILLAPPRASHGLLWILPWTAVGLGAGGLLFWLSRSAGRRTEAPATPAGTPPTADDDPYVRRVLDEVGE